VWNQALAVYDTACNTEGQYVPRYESMAKWVTDWKKVPETEWLKEAYTDNLQQKLKDLDTAWQRYFKKVGDAQRPRFKKRGPYKPDSHPHRPRPARRPSQNLNHDQQKLEWSSTL
jgi:putative transposase